MKDQETIEQFISLRAQGRSFAGIAQEPGVCKQTLINWSRKFRFQIQNLRAIELEALQHQWIDTQETRVRTLGEQLRLAQAELSKRDLADIPTGRLYWLVDSLRRQILRETGGMQFSTPLEEIPNEDYHEQVQDWSP